MAEHEQEHLLEEGQWLAVSKTPAFNIEMASEWMLSQLRKAKPLLSNTAKQLPSKLWRRDKSTTLSPTSYLDGLRGFAAFLVYILHHQLWAHVGFQEIIENAYGFKQRYYFAQLPVIRIFFSGGHLAVAIFFVISGYVLAARPLRLLHQGDLLKFNDSLSSALFRRWLRLWIPVIITTFIWMMLNWCIRDLSQHKPEAKLVDELRRYYHELKNFTFIFRDGGLPWSIYNFHIWTIPLEMRGSIVVWTVLMAFSRATKTMRLWLSVGLAVYFLYIVDGWYLACFMGGLLLCDLDILAEKDELPRFMDIFKPYKDWTFLALFAAGIYLGGVPAMSKDPTDLRNSPGWYYLSFLLPSAVFHFKNFYLFWAGVFLVASIQRISWLKSFFELPFNQYLGRISYALYLVHGPILWSIGDRVYAALGWIKDEQLLAIPRWINLMPLPKWGPMGLEVSFLAAHLLLLPLTLWVARIATSLVDDSSIRFARWLYVKTLTAPSAVAVTATASRSSSREASQKMLE